MKQSREQLEAIFQAALDLETNDQRAAYLDRACPDVELRREVESLLDAHCHPDTLFSGETRDSSKNAVGPKAGTVIGRYKLLQKIGEGGCGVVYMAEQEEPMRRRVALKIIKLGMDTKSVIARFEAERQALALMDHQNIAKVHDAGATETGRPYFVMELVRGVKITDYCDGKNLSTKERLDLFVQVCQAIQHAHQKGIIHRDIKPSNVLVTVNDGVAVPKVIDFGIAKATTDQRLTDKTVFTAFEQFVGTPAYMSPEQAEITSLDVDTRSDIYSLGVLLYELLTGKTPFDPKELLQDGLDEMRRTIREKEPERPSTRVSTLSGEERTTTAKHRGLDGPKLIHTLRGDLDWIVMKSLEKDRARRYETANGFASDIQRHLNNEPVVARPPSNFYKFQKLVRRNKVAFAAGIGIAAALVIGLAIALWQSIEKTRVYREQARLRQQAQSEAAKSQQVAEFLKEMLAGVGPSKALGRDTKMLREILDNTARRLDGLTNQPGVEADLREVLGHVYRELAEYTNALAMHRRALELRKRLFGDEHPAVAASLDHLGVVFNEQGELAEAERLHREALAMRRKLFGNEHRDVAVSLNNLAVVLKSQGRLAEAETNQREALGMDRKLFGNESSSVADSLACLAVMLGEQGKLTEAETIQREELALTRKLLGNEHPSVALSLGNLAAMLGEQGKLVEAETLHREALAMRRKLFGNEHPQVSLSLNGLATTLQQQGRKYVAESLFREALEMRRKLLGNDHPAVAEALNNLGSALWGQGKYAEAETTYRETLALARKALGNDHPSVAASLGNLGTALHKQGKLPEAEILFREALEIGRKSLGDEHPHIAVPLNNLARLLQDQGKLTDAASLLREAIELRRKQSGGDAKQGTPGLAVELANLAGVLLELGQLTEARSLAEEAVALHRAHPDWDIDKQYTSFNTLGHILAEQENLVEAEQIYSELLAIVRKRAPEQGWIAGATAELAVVLMAERKFADAELLARECLTYRQKNYPDTFSAFSARVLLGESLLLQKKYDEAEPLLRSGYEGLEQRKSSAWRRTPQPGIRKALELLVQLYNETGRTERLAEWKQKLTAFDGQEAADARQTADKQGIPSSK